MHSDTLHHRGPDEDDGEGWNRDERIGEADRRFLDDGLEPAAAEHDLQRQVCINSKDRHRDHADDSCDDLRARELRDFSEREDQKCEGVNVQGINERRGNRRPR